MNSSLKAVITVVVVLALGGGAYAAFHKTGSTAVNPNANTSPTPSTSNTNTSSSGAATSSTKAAATITFTDSGFSPAVTTVKVGDTIQVTNNSSQPLQFDSNPHPAHTDETELNIGEVAPGESRTFTVTKAGHWGFHDHLDASLTGTLNVR